MESYTNFAYVYDTFMDQEPYWMWADRFCRLLELYGLPRETDIKAGSETAGETGITDFKAECETGVKTDITAEPETAG